MAPRTASGSGSGGEIGDQKAQMGSYGCRTIGEVFQGRGFSIYFPSFFSFLAIVNEVSILAALSHPNIARLIGFVEHAQKGDAWIISPWEENGNVREFLQAGEWDIPERISLVSSI